MSQALPAAQALKAELKVRFKEREALVEGMIVALIAKEPLFILGPPGTAKSFVCETLCRAIGGNYFSLLMGAFTQPEELFGPLSLQGLQNDKFIRNVEGKLPWASVAFLDEIFKSSSAILNTLLTVMNERVYYNDGPKKVPLETLFAASNEVPTKAELGAVWDRMVLRYQVSEIKSDANFLDLLENGVDLSQMPSITPAQLTDLQQSSQKLKLNKGTSDKIREVRNAVREKGITVSDRKWMQASRVVRAVALLNGHSEVEIEDLLILENILWNQPEQAQDIRSLVRKLVSPLHETVQRNMDAVHAAVVDVNNGKLKMVEGFEKLQVAKKALDKLYAEHQKQFISDASGEIGEICKGYADRLFKKP